jgi:hypothetical protein
MGFLCNAIDSILQFRIYYGLFDQLFKPKTSVFVIGDEFSNAYSSNPYQNKFWLTN